MRFKPNLFVLFNYFSIALSNTYLRVLSFLHSSATLDDMPYLLEQWHRALGYEALYNCCDYIKGIPDSF
jgi:hypothetical protein